MAVGQYMADRRLAIGEIRSPPDSHQHRRSLANSPILLPGARQLGFASGKLRHRTANGAWRKTAGCFETVRSIDRESTARKIRRRRRSDLPIQRRKGRRKLGKGDRRRDRGTSLIHVNSRGRYGSEPRMHWFRDFSGNSRVAS